jgi:tRNA A-37 threonylcarbamoyl transferase component Bud32
MTDDDFESRVLGFERLWLLGGPCEIAAFLDRPPASRGQQRCRLLVELICIDLEFRWKNQPADQGSLERRLLESYAADFPELGPLADLPLELIGEEYRVRCRFGDRPTHSEFLTRFPTKQEQLEAELHRIDRELREELAALRVIPLLPAVRTPTHQALDIPSLSYRDILLRRMIGSGRMGKVYEAWQHSGRRVVAVKFLRKSFLHQPEIVERFIAEARIIARLRHPNIVGIHGLGRTPGGAYFIAMQLIAGSNLDLRGRVRPISVEEAIRWTIETCDALGHAHSRGIIHCDLKPANLLLDRDGSVRVTDFGLSRCLTEHPSWTAEVEGTAPFMAPEQASRYWGPIDVHTDIYGVGAVLYALLTGRPPWIGRRLPDILADVISAAPVIPPNRLRPDLPESLSELCRKCLSKRPEDRYRTAQEVRSALIDMNRVKI